MRVLLAAGLCGGVAAALPAQRAEMAMDHGQMTAPARPLTAHVRDQIAAAHRAALLLDTPEKARAAGYRPRFGDVPLQGIHYSNPLLVLSGKFDIDHPPTLMFIPVDDTMQLVGVAYTYEIKDGNAVPDGFDGAAMWHEHPALSLPGHRLVMTHVWFVDSPNGPFAHDNPTLPFVERDMHYPPAGWLDAETTRNLALALSLAARQAPGGGRLNLGPRSDSAVNVLARERDTVGAQAQRLEALEQAGRKADYQRLAVTIGSETGALVATIKAIPSDSLNRAVLGRLIDESPSEHMAKP